MIYRLYIYDIWYIDDIWCIDDIWLYVWIDLVVLHFCYGNNMSDLVRWFDVLAMVMFPQIHKSPPFGAWVTGDPCWFATKTCTTAHVWWLLSLLSGVFGQLCLSEAWPQIPKLGESWFRKKSTSKQVAVAHRACLCWLVFLGQKLTDVARTLTSTPRPDTELFAGRAISTASAANVKALM